MNSKDKNIKQDGWHVCLENSHNSFRASTDKHHKTWQSSEITFI